MMKITKSIVYSITYTLLLTLLISSAVIAQNGTDWSDNFNDGDLNGWTTQFGTFSVLDGKLHAISSGESIIDHPSDVAYGSWSFDVLSITEKRPHIVFIGEGNWNDPIYNYAAPKNAYAIVIEKDNTNSNMYFDFGRYSSGINWNFLAEFKPASGLNGWQKINITRNSEGLFKVYINDTLRIEVTDNTITTSDRFEIFTVLDTEFDNIEVISQDNMSESKDDDAGTSIDQSLLVMIIGISFMTKYQSRFRSAYN